MSEPIMAREEQLERVAALIKESQHILFITGAGLSADSGLPTYRGVGGLYEGALTEEQMPIEEALSGRTWMRRPEITWRHIAQIERACRGAAPNRGHEVIAALEAEKERVWVLTQNVDGLHQAAGSRNVIAIHGDVHLLNCTRCDWEARVADYAHLSDREPPRCPRCEGLVKPGVVLFGEGLPAEAMRRYDEEMMRGFELVVSIGTTSVFPYIAQPVRSASRRQRPTVEINPGQTVVSDEVTYAFRERAASLLDTLWQMSHS